VVAERLAEGRADGKCRSLDCGGRERQANSVEVCLRDRGEPERIRHPFAIGLAL
jgi:hypothetical protein